MKSPLKFALFFALCAIAFRLIIFYGNYSTERTGQYIIMLHLLFILLSVFFGIMTGGAGITDEKKGIAEDIKAGAKAGSLYAVIISAFVFVYFRFLDTTHFTTKREELIRLKILDSPDQDPLKIRETIEGTITLSNYVVTTLLGLVAVAFVYSLILTVVNRFILVRLKK